MTARTCLGILTLCVASLLVPSTSEAQVPPNPVFCDIVGGSNTVVLTWINNGPYFQIQIQMDGATIATLPPATTTHTIPGVSPGWHTFCVLGLDAAGGVIHPVSCCDQFVPGVGPIPSLDCSPVAGALGVFLSWVNGGVYGTIEIEVDGIVVDTIPGPETTYTLIGLTPGPHTICVRPFDGAFPVLPEACCDVVVAGAGDPVSALTCTPLATAAGVVVNWANGGAYDLIEITVDGVLVASLAGADTSYVLVPLAAGPHTVCVTPYLLGSAILPAACCSFTIGSPGGGPIDPLSCIPLPSLPNGIFLTWTNNGAYSSIEVRLDGALVAVLPGSDTSYSFVGLPPGAHTACLRAFIAGAAVAPDACCTFAIPGAGDPIDPLTCLLDPAVPNSIFLSWTNNGVYSSIDLILDGALAVVLPGNATNYQLAGLSPGVHTVCLRAYAGGATLAPDACCTVTVGSAINPIDPLSCVQDPAVPDAIFLSWTNNGVYSSIEVILDGAVAAVLPGNATNTLLGGLSAGPHTVCLRAFVAGAALAPDACCDFTTPGVGPIDPLFCELVTTGGVTAVLLTWTNNGAYTSIQVELDGATVAVLPGSATSHLLTGIGAGVHVVCVRPTIGGVALAPTCCQFTVDDPDPIGALQCAETPFAVGIQLTWGNGGVYTSIEVELDGAVVAILGGSDTSFLLGGLFAPGSHTICVVPYVGATAILPPACCTFVVPPRFVRGDSNADALFNIADTVFLLAYLFANGPAPQCDDAADANDDGQLNIADGISILATLFGGGPPPPAPHPSCGNDPTGDPLGCANFPPCP